MGRLLIDLYSDRDISRVVLPRLAIGPLHDRDARAHKADDFRQGARGPAGLILRVCCGCVSVLRSICVFHGVQIGLKTCGGRRGRREE